MLPARGSRTITVDGVRYRWRLRRRPTAAQHAGAPLTVAVAWADAPGQTLLLALGYPHTHNDAGLRGASVQPGHVAAWIRGALAAGWTPTVPGPPLQTRELFGVSPARAVPTHRRPLTHEQAAALAAQPHRDRVSLEGRMLHINGIPLLELVRQAEQPHVDRENALRAQDPEDGGQLTAAGYLPWLLGLPQTPGSSDHGFALAPDDPLRQKQVLLGCSCGIVECWFLLADTWTLGDAVIWANFEQFHRGWIYDLGPLVFDRAAFEALQRQ